MASPFYLVLAQEGRGMGDVVQDVWAAEKKQDPKMVKVICHRDSAFKQM